MKDSLLLIKCILHEIENTLSVLVMLVQLASSILEAWGCKCPVMARLQTADMQMFEFIFKFHFTEVKLSTQKVKLLTSTWKMAIEYFKTSSKKKLQNTQQHKKANKL